MDDVKKRGRPMIENAKKERLGIRLSDEDINMLDYLCYQTGKSKSDIVRESLKIYRNLVKYGAD